MTHDEFVTKASDNHNNAYEYPNQYEGYDIPIIIHCTKHGEFTTTPRQHLRRGKKQPHGGCPKCKISTKRISTNAFVARATIVHNNKYDYSETKYHTNKDLVTIRCPKHGDFEQIAANHLRGMGCAKCAGKNITTSDFIARSNIVHNNKYDYSQVKYKANNQKVVITCPNHGNFTQLVNDHMNSGHGCPVCGGRTSHGQQAIADHISELGFRVQQNVKDLISSGEIDVYVPDCNLAIEYCGVYWHSERTNRGRHYHATKYKECRNHGIQLLTIFSDEWETNQELVLRTLTHKLGKSIEKIYARTTFIKELSTPDRRCFLNQNHIQGDAASTKSYGLYYANKVVAVAAFKCRDRADQAWELVRYATSINVVGGFSKLLHHFCSSNNWTTIVTFADNRWSDGELYIKTGWVYDGSLAPDYTYCPDNKSRVHKFNYRHSMLGRLLETYDNTKSEYQNCLTNNIYRVWDCGKQRYKLINENNR